MTEQDFFRVEVSDHDGQIVAIEPRLLSGRDIGDAEDRTIRRAMEHLAAFIGRDPASESALRNELQAEQCAHQMAKDDVKALRERCERLEAALREICCR